MADRNRRFLVGALALAAVLLLGYAILTAVLIARGELELGPFRVLTVVANVLAGVLSGWAAFVFARQKPRP